MRACPSSSASSSRSARSQGKSGQPVRAVDTMGRPIETPAGSGELPSVRVQAFVQLANDRMRSNQLVGKDGALGYVLSARKIDPNDPGVGRRGRHARQPVPEQRAEGDPRRPPRRRQPLVQERRRARHQPHAARELARRHRRRAHRQRARRPGAPARAREPAHRAGPPDRAQGRLGPPLRRLAARRRCEFRGPRGHERAARHSRARRVARRARRQQPRPRRGLCARSGRRRRTGGGSRRHQREDHVDARREPGAGRGRGARGPAGEQAAPDRLHGAHLPGPCPRARHRGLGGSRVHGGEGRHDARCRGARRGTRRHFRPRGAGCRQALALRAARRRRQRRRAARPDAPALPPRGIRRGRYLL